MAGGDKAIVTEAAQKYGIRPDVLWGLYGTETNFGRDLSTSSAGAEGPFQFEPATARSMGVNPHDFRSSAFGAARFLSQYKSRGVGGMLSAYNAGPAGGYQSGYVSKTLQNAKSYGSAPSGPIARMASTGGEERIKIPGVKGYTLTGLNSQAFAEAKEKVANDRLLRGQLPNEFKSLISLEAPKISDYLSQTNVPGTPGREEVLKGPGTSGRVPAGHELHGLLPAGAHVLEWKRRDQGHDVQLRPGQVLLATGNGVVIRNGSDPSGFGPSYPIVHWTSGPEAGKDTYYGHTDSLVKPGQRLTAGQPVARTSKTGHNAPPGWLEYGYAPGGTPGPFGQSTPF